MCNARTKCRGFTLLEMVASVGVSAVLLTGMSSALLLAMRALPRSDRPTDALLSESRALARFVAELEAACVITEQTATAVTFTLPDRDGNGLPERVRYAWTGTAGDPLTREFNGGGAVAVVANVQQLSLTYDIETATEQYSGLPVESAETPLSSCTTVASAKDNTVDGNHWYGNYIQVPTTVLGANCISWRPTRVQIYTRKDGSLDGTMRVQIRLPLADNTPSGSVVDETIFNEPNNNSYAWYDVLMSGTTQLAPTQAVCLIHQHATGPSSGKLRSDNSGGSGLESTSSAGGNWSYDSAHGLMYALHGKYLTPSSPVTLTRQYVTGVRIALRAGTDASARLDTAARPVNAPEVLTAQWAADFQGDPATPDNNGDGSTDWVYGLGGGTPATPSGGVWSADRTLTTTPANNFTQLTCVEVSFRDSVAGANGGAAAKVPVECSGGQCGVLYATVQQASAGSQTVMVDLATDATHTQRVATVNGLGTGFQQVRLIANPANDTVNVNVNGQDLGTFAYARFAGESLRGVQLYPVPGKAGAQFHAVRVRIGGSAA